MRFINSFIDRICFKLVDKLFDSVKRGKMVMELPDGTERVYSGDDRDIVAHVKVNNMNFFRKCVLYGSLGLGESYVDGDWDADDIGQVIALVILNIHNNETFTKKKATVNFMSFVNKVIYWLRSNTLKGSRENIADHYDLGNDFFKTFLDPSMTYSSAIFEHSEQTLKEAQQSKYKNLCEKLRLNSKDQVLEIGSGWGGFAVYAAKNYGCHVTTTTISQEQYDHVKALIKEEGLEKQIDIELTDYRHLKGKYDKVASIEMIEAVGHDFLPKYFEQCHALLKEDGLLGLQMILFPDHRYELSRKSVDWIQKHIFPGSLLPSMKAVHDAINQTGRLNLYNYEDITSHYVKTLLAWKENFNKRSEEILKMGRDRHFIRKWNYYFSYCAAAFAMRHISVAQAIFTRSNNRKLHDDLEMVLTAKDQEMLQHLNNNMSERD